MEKMILKIEIDSQTMGKSIHNMVKELQKTLLQNVLDKIEDEFNKMQIKQDVEETSFKKIIIDANEAHQSGFNRGILAGLQRAMCITFNRMKEC